MVTVTAGHLRAIAGGKAPLASNLVDPINRHAAAHGITTPLRMAHFLAHMAEETGGFSRLEENLNYTTAARLMEVWPSRFKTASAAKPFLRNPKALAIKVYGGRLGNAAAPSPDGWDYRGGGPFQLTGRANYAKFGAAAGVDLEANPALARDPDTGVEVAARYFAARMVKAADKDDIVATTKALNGGTTNLAERRKYLAKAKAALASGAAAREPAARSGAAASIKPLYKPGVAYPELERLQASLKALGYHDVGMVDGKWGNRTRDALLAFKADNALPLSVDLDDATWAALAKASPRPVSEARKTATVEDLAPHSTTIQATRASKFWTYIGGIPAAVAGAAQGIFGSFDEALEKLGPVRELFDSVPGWMWGAGAAGVAFMIWRSANTVELHRIENHRSGAQG